MEILNNFGFNPLLFAAQIVNFLIIFYLLKRFMFKPVLALLEKRKQDAKSASENSEKAAILLEKTKTEEKELLKKAKQEADKYIASARAQSDALQKEAETEAKKKIDAMISDAREQIQLETKEAEKKIAVHTVTIAQSMLQASLKELIGPKEQEEVLKKAAKTLGKAD
jgi:F-type H+-transporting ATPase subunit b